MKVTKIFASIIILFFVLGHLMVISMFMCPASMLLNFAEGGEVDYISLTETPDYIKQIFLVESDGMDYFSDQEYAPDARLLASVLGNRVAKKTLKLRYDKFFDEEERQEFYLNTLNFGGDVIGISAASDYYFQKSAKDLSFEESLTLGSIYQIFDK